MLIRIMALDPGGTTGWASWTAERIQGVAADSFEYKNVTWDNGQLGPEHHKLLWSVLELMHVENCRIVCERFEYRNTSRAGLVLDSREYIGIAKLFSQERGVPLEFQNASEAKGFVRDSHLKRLALWSSGYPHANDAMRHLLFYLTNKFEDKEYRKTLLAEGWK